MIIPLFFALHTDPRFLQKVMWYKSTNHRVLGGRNIFLIIWIFFGLFEIQKFSVYLCLITACSTDTAPKKIKMYLYLIHIQLRKEIIAFDITSPPGSWLHIHTFLLKEGSTSPQQAENLGRISVVPAKSIATVTFTLSVDGSKCHYCAITTSSGCISPRPSSGLWQNSLCLDKSQ